MWADRNVLSNAADLVYALAPRLDEEQSRHVGMALVETIRRNNLDRSSYRSACLALARLAKTHPDTLEELDVPTARLAEMAGRDVLNDLYKAGSALINLALAGHEEARREAQNLLEHADTLTRVSWRHALHDIQEEELASAIRQLLPQSVGRVQTHAGMTSVGFGAFSPMFLRDWTLPESVKSEVAQVLSEAVIDPTALLPDRQAAAFVLGLKAEQFGEDDRLRAIEALMGALMQPFEADDSVRSIDNPLSMLRMNIGQPEDVIAAAIESLLAFSGQIEDSGQRRRLLEEVGKRNASQVEPIGRSVAAGLRHFAPRDTDEEQWFQTRLLLLLYSHHPSVRQSAAQSLAIAVEQETLDFDAELLATVLFLAEDQIVEDRGAAAHALARMEQSDHWSHPEVSNALEALRSDPSYLVRRRADGN